MFSNIRFKRPKIKRSSLKTFSFFLLFSSIIWFLVQISKEYTQVLQIPIKYENRPLDKSLSEEKPKHLALRIADKGFTIWYYKIIRPQVIIDLGKAKEKNGTLVYNFEINRELLEEQVDIDLENATFLEEEVVVNFQPKAKTYVKLQPRLSLNYAIGYSATEPVALKPDSVMVSGPQDIIDTLKSLNTVKKKINNINSNINGKIKIDTTGFGMLGFYQNEVFYSQKVEKFTEGKVEVPVEILNLPEGVDMTIFPKEVLIYFQVNLEQYEMVKASDFRVVVDYNVVDSGEDYMIANISKKPKFVNNLRINERKIQFVIKK